MIARHPRLTPRQHQVMLLRVGPDEPGEDEIAARLGLTPNTVHAHRDAARRAMGCATFRGAELAFARWVWGTTLTPRRSRRVDQDTTLGLIEA